MSNNIIYLRQLRKINYTTFGIGDKSIKQFVDPIFNKKVPFASGQQVKRCIIEKLLSGLESDFSPTNFRFKYDAKSNKITEDVVLQDINPKYVDQLFGGYMRTAPSKKDDGKKKKDSKDEDEKDAINESTIKRRSPLSISAFRPLHALFTTIAKKETATFDRRDSKTATFSLLDENDNEVPLDKIEEYLLKTGKTLTKSKFLELIEKVSGLFVYDVAINLDRLFTVSTSSVDPEVTQEVISELISLGWEKKNSQKLGDYLVCPKELREKWALELARGLVTWEFNSNQSRSFDMADVLVTAVGNNPMSLNNSIYAVLHEVDGKQRANLVVDELSDVNIFAMNSLKQVYQYDNTTSDAIKNTISHIYNMIMDYEV